METGHTQSQTIHDLRADVSQTVRMLPIRPEPYELDDLTGYVERYLPPVPPARPRP